MIFVGLNILCHLIIPHHHHDTWDEASLCHEHTCIDSDEHSDDHLHIVDHFDQANWGFQYTHISLKYLFIEVISCLNLYWVEIDSSQVQKHNFISSNFNPVSPHLVSITLRGPPQFL
ncbi:MAG TPA: hypothetical protein PLH86_06395 [Saprospiraceae bacterium]|jgi:hypothetical protein|nr:hypothetical protein [Saprospiraceae bacterium]